MPKRTWLLLNYLLVISLLLPGISPTAYASGSLSDQPELEANPVLSTDNAPSFYSGGMFQGPGGNHGGQSGPGENPGGSGRRGPGQTNGVGLGGPGGNGPGGPGGPGHFGGLEGMGSAGFGGRGGGGGLSGIGPGGIPRPNRGGLGLDGGLSLGQGRPNAGSDPGQNGSDRPGLGGGLGSGQGRPGRPSNSDTPVGPGGPGSGGLAPGTGLGSLLFGSGAFEIPASPSLSGRLERGQAAQAAAQQAAGQGQEAINRATETAQAAYEQMWEDYYNAVDYAAEAYYDAVTGAIDYGAETFEEYYNQAVSQAQQAVNSYYQYYGDYLAYAALYPWDSYAYTYDEATGEYAATETVNNYYYNYYYGGNQSAITPTIPVSPTASELPAAPPLPQMPAPSQEAYKAIVVFANDQLGATVTPVYAGQVTEETLALLASLPAQAQNPIYEAQNVAVTAYYGLLKGGVATVALGDCSEGAGCQLSGDLPADLSNLALGSYALQTPEVMPANPGDALELVTLVYPKLTGLQFTQAADIPGYAFSATTTSVALDANKQPTFVAKVVFAGVTNANGRTIVYAVVGLGETYAEMVNPFSVNP